MDISNSDNIDSDSSDIIKQKQLDTLKTDEMFSGRRFAILAMFIKSWSSSVDNKPYNNTNGGPEQLCDSSIVIKHNNLKA